MGRRTTLWSTATPDQRLFEYTTGDDRIWTPGSVLGCAGKLGTSRVCAPPA